MTNVDFRMLPLVVAMYCFACTTALQLMSTSRPVDALSDMARLHMLYNESLRRLEWELEKAWDEKTDGAAQQHEHINKSEWLQQARDGSIRWDRAASLATFMQLCQPKDMLEIGSFLGLSANFYLRVMAQWGGRLTSVDPNIRHRVFDWPRQIFNKVNKPYQNRLRTFDAFWMQKMSLESGHWDYENIPPFVDNATVSAIFDRRDLLTPKDFIAQGKTFDMAFIDGAHDYDSVKKDFENVLSVLRPGACVIFDDIDEHAWPDTHKAFMDIYQQAFNTQQGLAVFGDQTAMFIDRGFIADAEHRT